MSVEAAAGDFTFIIFSVLLFVFVVFTFLCVPETKNLTFEEIANKFCPGDDIEVEVVLEDAAAAAASTPPTAVDHCPDDGPEHHRQQGDGAVVTFDLGPSTLSMVEKQRPEEEDDETGDRTKKTITHTKL